MGVQDLPKELRASGELKSNISELNGKIVGIDSSIFLHKALKSSPEITMLFHQKPSVTLGHLIDRYFDRLYNIFEANNVKILFVVDGLRNPLKGVTNEAREKISTDAANRLLKMIESCDQELLNDISALKKKALYVRDDILGNFIDWSKRKGIIAIAALMEAEWELCRLAQDNVIDCVLSEDSDCFVLGNQDVLQMLDINAHPSKTFNCTIVKVSPYFNYVNQILENPSRSELADFAVLLGNDYVSSPYGNSVKNVTLAFKDWRT